MGERKTTCGFCDEELAIIRDDRLTGTVVACMNEKCIVGLPYRP